MRNVVCQPPEEVSGTWTLHDQETTTTNARAAQTALKPGSKQVIAATPLGVGGARPCALERAGPLEERRHRPVLGP